ncbi:unnamed protein product [Cuscuta campestris]|uniref:Uncharacterized protein n=1 Tax=Cuscuta campestris TaxID=132261 RepID=A0A484L5P6_9ASTE|nr:unnamed protein product [Cuscuta campestris]
MTGEPRRRSATDPSSQGPIDDHRPASAFCSSRQRFTDDDRTRRPMGVNSSSFRFGVGSEFDGGQGRCCTCNPRVPAQDWRPAGPATSDRPSIPAADGKTPRRTPARAPFFRGWQAVLFTEDSFIKHQIGSPRRRKTQFSSFVFFLDRSGGFSKFLLNFSISQGERYQTLQLRFRLDQRCERRHRGESPSFDPGCEQSDLGQISTRSGRNSFHRRPRLDVIQQLQRLWFYDSCSCNRSPLRSSFQLLRPLLSHIKDKCLYS